METYLHTFSWTINVSKRTLFHKKMSMTSRKPCNHHACPIGANSFFLVHLSLSPTITEILNVVKLTGTWLHATASMGNRSTNRRSIIARE